MRVRPDYLLKLDRAHKHLEDAATECARYLDGKPYAIRAQKDADVDEWSVYIRVTKAPQPEIALMAGDCIHNLRAALDHVVYDLSRNHNGRIVNQTAFPILGHIDQWDARNDDGSLKVSSGMHKLRGVPPKAMDRIKVWQPFNPMKPPFDDPYKINVYGEQLRVLHDLDIVDKHRNLNVVTAALDLAYWAGGPPANVLFYREGPLDLDAETLFLKFASQVNVNPQAELQVCLVDALGVGHIGVVDALKHLDGAVVSIIVELQRFFDPPR